MSGQSTILQGALHTYDAENRLTAFVNGNNPSVLVVIGGLSDGFAHVSVPILPSLGGELANAKWSLVVANLRSSYSAWGISSIDTDVADISKLVKYLHSLGKSQIVLVGHSTGCQDLVHFFKTQPKEILDHVSGVILQAPVSDQEAFRKEVPADVSEKAISSAEKTLQEFNSKHANTPKDKLPWPGSNGPLVPFSDLHLPFFNDTVFTASRFLSLFKERGYEDFFSSYLSDDELRDHLQPLSKVPLLILPGKEDEYVPDNVDRQLLLDRFIRAASSSESKHPRGILLEGANHNLSNPEGGQNFLKVVMNFVQNLNDYV